MLMTTIPYVKEMTGILNFFVDVVQVRLSYKNFFKLNFF